MSLRERTRPGLGIIEPCLPSPAERPPSGPGWLHEIKHDGFRIMARRDGPGEKLITRHGNDFSSRFPVIVAAVTALPAQSFLIAGEAIVTNGDGLAVFDLIRHKRHGDAAVLVAFDLIELAGDDLRHLSIEYRKRKLAKLVRRPDLGIVLNEHYEGDGEIIFKHACTGLGGHRLETTWLALPLGALTALGQDQESGRTGSEARGRGGLGAVMAAHKQRKLSSRGRSPAPESRRTDSAPIRATVPLIEQYYVAVDRQLKSGFGTYEAAEKAAMEIKKRYPNPQVTVFDAKKRSHTAIEQPIASTKRRG